MSIVVTRNFCSTDIHLPWRDTILTSAPNSAEWVLFLSNQIVPLCVFHVRSLPSYLTVVRLTRDSVSEKEYDELWSRERGRIMIEEELERPKHFKYQAYC